MSNAVDTVPCKICGEAAWSKGIKLCDGCWEVEIGIWEMIANCINEPWLSKLHDVVALRLHKLHEDDNESS